MNFIFSQLVSINTHFPAPNQIPCETPLTRTACNLHVRRERLAKTQLVRASGEQPKEEAGQAELHGE